MFKRFLNNIFEEEFIKRVLTPITIVMILTWVLLVFYKAFVCYVVSIGFASLYFYTKYSFDVNYEEVYEQTNELPKVEVKKEIEEEIKPKEPVYQNQIMANPYENVNSSLTEEEQEAFDEVFGIDDKQREYAPVYNQYEEFDERAFEKNVDPISQMQANQSVDRQQAPVRQNVQRKAQNRGGQARQVSNGQAQRQREPQPQAQQQHQQALQRMANQNARPVRQQSQANNQNIQQQPSNRQRNVQNQNRQVRQAQPTRQRPATRAQKRPNNQRPPQRTQQKKQFSYDEDFEFEYYPYDD